MRTKKQSFKNIPDNESIKENSNIKKKYKKILRDLSIANQTISTLKRKLNEKERNNNYNNFNNSIESNPMNITAIYNTKKYNKSYVRTTINLFRDYKEYIDKKNYAKLNPNKNTMNNYKSQLNDMNNVRDFLLNERGLTDSTYKNRYNLLRRTLIKLNGNNGSLVNDLIIKETKNKTDKIFSNKKEREEYLYELYEENELELILMNYFIFILGFNISQIAFVKVNNFYNEFRNLKITRNLKSIKRTIETTVSDIIKIYIKNNSLLPTNYLIYPSIKNTKTLTRTAFLEKRFKTFINFVKSLTAETKKKMFAELHLERTRVSLTLLELFLLKNFQMNFDIKEEQNNNEKSSNYSKGKKFENEESNLFNLNLRENNSEDSNFNINKYENEELQKNDSLFFNNSFIDIFSDNNKSLNKLDSNEEDLLFLSNDSEELKSKNLYFNSKKIKFKFNGIKDKYECENNKNDLFKIFKKYDMKFYDDSFSLDESLLYYNSCNNTKNIPFLDNDNFSVYKKMKKNSLNGIYPNLKLLKLKGDTCIQATRDIEKNTLLFEIGGEVMTDSTLNKIYKKFENRYWCYFNLFNPIINENNKIVLSDIGNIAFFLQGSKNYDNNVGIKEFILENTGKIVCFVYNIKKIYKNDILINNLKLTKI
jgi:hypothetical protein